MASLWLETDLATLHEIALQFDSMSLQSWGLSSRTMNALLSHNFKMTVGDVIRAGKNLASIKGLGEAGINELNMKLSLALTGFYNKDDAQLSLAPQFKLLSQSVQSLPLDQLHLDRKTHNALVKSGITSIGELYTKEGSFLDDLQGFHSDSLGNINSALIALLDTLNNENEVDWFQYWKRQGIQVLPTITASDAKTEEIFKNIPKIVEEVLRQETDERSWTVIQRRFGLGKTEKLTLEDIGSAYGITRERIRQIENKALKALHHVFVGQRYAGKNYHVHPVIHQVIQTILSILEEEPSTLILETRLLEHLRQKFGSDFEKAKPSLILFMTLINAQYLEIDYQASVPIWGYTQPGFHQILERGIRRLDDFLTRETTLPQAEIDISIRLNRKTKKSEALSPAQLSWLIDLCASIERLDDGSVRGKFECLKGRGNQVERILIETGSPMKVIDIARQINHRLVPLGQRRITEANLLNQIISDGRFVAIGRSGTWGLKSWSHIDTKSILTLMEECLIAQNKPVTVDEIFTYVSERRPVSKQSIIIYLLYEKNIFAKFSQATWGLAKWSNMTEMRVWGKDQVADFIANIFKSSKAKELSYKLLREALMQEANINAKQAQGLLNTNPVIKTRSKRAWSEKIAVFQPNYKDLIAQAQLNPSQQRVSLYKQIEESARDILDAAPGKQMLMAELVHQLHKELECSAPTIYNYLKTMGSIERIDIPGTKKKMCRLKEMIANNSANDRTLRQRISKSVRAILEAAPNKQMALTKLIVRLQKEYSCPKATIYQYISGLDYIERLDIPHSRAKLCRMKDTGFNLFPQTQHIVNPTLREKVERALPFLTEENVDIGLFLLSKEFEATLKAYLIKASAKGKLTNNPPGKSSDKWNLIGMVDCAKENNIITDHATFHYLRQTRNDRAHGSMPSLAERQVLMKHVQYIAGLYIDYIKILDDLTQIL